MGLNFYYNDGIQPKMRAGIINEHECSGAQMMVGKSSVACLGGRSLNTLTRQGR